MTEEDAAPLLVGVLDLTQKRVLAVRGATQKQQEQVSALTLYEAIISQRQLEPRAISGLTWHLPLHLYTPEVPSPTWLTWSNVLHVALEREAAVFPFVEELRTLWNNLCRTRTLVPDRWGMTFESALNATYGTSPLRARERNEHRFSHLHGYMADPAWLFPALRFQRLYASSPTSGRHGWHRGDYLSRIALYG